MGLIQIKRDNISDQLTSIIADRIVRNQIEPGDRISESGLSKEYGTSRSPVRDALHQLEKIWLVERTPKGRYCVVKLTRERIYHLYDSVNICFQYAFARSAERGTPKDMEAIDKNVKSLEKSIEKKDFDLYLRTVTDLAGIVLAASGNPVVQTMAMDLMPTAERIQWTAINKVPDQLRITVNHLKRGFQFIKNRQPEEAAKTFADFSTAHIEVVLNHLE